MHFLLFPVASLDAQNADSLLSEACLCRAEFVQCQLRPDARSELRAAVLAMHLACHQPASAP